ncbi:MAG: LemA family protein, partial [Psychroserpens sp.]|nr:LemA family protein [Psychroserpens sp.]
TRYNEAIKPYNKYVRKAPRSLIAGMIGYDEKPYFDAEAGSDKPVDVDFDFNN